jgi:hypothetical protein
MTDTEARAIALEAAERVYAETRKAQIASGKDPASRICRDEAFLAANNEYTRVYVAKLEAV